jgi:hypothetical protein
MCRSGRVPDLRRAGEGFRYEVDIVELNLVCSQGPRIRQRRKVPVSDPEGSLVEGRMLGNGALHVQLAKCTHRMSWKKLTSSWWCVVETTGILSWCTLRRVGT